MEFILIIGLLFVILIPYMIFVILAGTIIWLIKTKLIKSKILKILIIVTILLFTGIILINFKDEKTSELYIEMKQMSDNQNLIGLSKEQVVAVLGEPIDKYNEKESKEVYSYNAGNIAKGLFFGDKAILFDCYYGYELRVVFDENDTAKSTYLHCVP